MVFTWFIKGRAYMERVKPQFLSKTPHFTFISLHYIYVMGMTIIGSILLYPRGGIRYIDALFFAGGCATQSGLNTVDVNTLSTYQQIVLMVIAMMCNPIAINTFVVFLRLYWFEKRFQDVAMEAKRARGSISRSRSHAIGDVEKGQEPRGVDGRRIVVMHHTSRPIPGAGTDKDDFGKTPLSTEVDEVPNSESSAQSSEKVGSDAHDQQLGITFADQVKRSDGMSDEPLLLPRHMSKEEHVRILERQRNPEDKGVLRIPGPRDADAGRTPERVEEEEHIRETLRRGSLGTFPGSENEQRDVEDGEHAHENSEPRRNIVIQEPVRPHSTHHRKNHVLQDLDAAGHATGLLRIGKPKFGKASNEEDHPMSRPRAMSFSTLKTALTQSKGDDMPYLSWQATVGRNSAFADLTEEQREELGGIEYRSLKTLSNVLLLYFWGYTLFGIVSLAPWIMHASYGAVVTNDAQARPWWAIFTAVSAFTDLGFTLTPDSMISFQGAVWPLLLMSFLIVVGNTGFPIMLRLWIWMLSMVVPRDSGLWEELRFLLDHPRRCFALLFPAAATWWLMAILVLLNGVDLVLFIILDLGNTVVTHLPVSLRILDGFFQAVSTRTAGFGVVNLSLLHPGIQVSYLIMMYISVLPIAMSVRRTNVYEEKSLGIYGSPEEEMEDEGEPSYIGAHLRRQLSFDLWFIFLGFFAIAIAEGARIQDSKDQGFTMFAVLFEIVSAYGTVGLSLGYPTINASFSGEFNVISKLVIIAMQIRGRHRGLPYELDRAIMLKGELLREKEDQIASTSIRRRTSNATFATATGVDANPDARANDGEHGRRESLRSESRNNRTLEKSTDFFSGFLRPGPTPNLRSMRRHSTADMCRAGDSEEDKYGSGAPRSRRMSGRRNFYQEGLNDG